MAEHDIGDLVVCISVRSKKPTLGWIVRKTGQEEQYRIEWQDNMNDRYYYNNRDIALFKRLLKSYGTQ